MGVRVEWNDARLKREMRQAAVDAVNTLVVAGQQEIDKQLNQGASNRGRNPSAPGSPPHKDTGHLARSFQIGGPGNLYKDNTEALNPSARLGSNVPYARIHEYGGRITPKSAQALTVPIGEEGRRMAKRAGSSGIRSLDLAYIPRKGQEPLLAEIDSAGNVQPRFILTRATVLAARPYVRPAMQALDKRKGKIVEHVVREAIKRLNR